MEMLLYALTFPPIVLITLVVHEAGHMGMARLLHVKVTGFQIGIGPKIATVYTGKTKVAVAGDQPLPEPGQVIHYWAAAPSPEDGDVQHRAALWQPALSAIKRKSKRLQPPAEQKTVEEATAFNRIHSRCTGRVSEVGPGYFTIADTAWSLAWIPVVAMVQVAEDPKGQDPGFFNTSSWHKQMLIILAGVGANLALLGMVIMALAAAPIGSEGQQILIVSEVRANSPADFVGIMPGDVITRAGGSILPTPETLRTEISEANRKGEYLLVTINRNGEISNLYLLPAGETIGIRYTLGTIQNQHPRSIFQRFLRLGETYMMSLAYLFQGTEVANTALEDQPKVSGIVAATYYTAQAVKTAHLQAWLAMLGVITMSAAIINLIPVPPLDGFQLLIRSVRCLRGGRPINDKAEQAIGLSGMAAIMVVFVYLIYQDIIHLYG